LKHLLLFHKTILWLNCLYNYQSIDLHKKKMKTLFLSSLSVIFTFLIISTVEAQSTFVPTCDPSGNWILFANYDGGNLNIVVDQNIPNLKIGICTYEPVNVTFSGPFVNSVTEVLYAGFNSAQNNNNCAFPITTSSFTGINPAILTVNVAPPVTIISPPNPNYFNIPNGWNSGIICLYSCNMNANQGGCNTVDQVLAYFQSQFGGVLRGLNVQYNCWDTNTPLTISAQAGNCCGACVPDNISLNQTVCNDQFPYSWNGLTFNGPGTQSVTLTNSAGCDSLVTLNLAVSPNAIGTDIQTACGSYTWLDGNTYTSSTNTPLYTIVGGNVYGCDSTVNLNLTINPITYSVLNVESCGPFVAENGQLYSESTTFTYTLPNSNGCDSIVTVNLNVLPVPLASFTSSPETLEYGFSEIQLLDLSSGQIDAWNWTVTSENGLTQTSNNQNPIFTFASNTTGNITFQLSVSNNLGCSNDITSILSIIEDAAIYIPNTFSPDGDAFNNTFHAYGKNIDPNHFEMSVFNRWGELIFTSKDPSVGWDGSVADRGSAPDGVYSYQLSYRFLNQSKSDVITGHLNLVR
jgi:gliding motility-associated-like protein